MNWFKKKSISEIRKELKCSEKEAWKNLEIAAEKLVKEARWYPYSTKVNQLRKPLIQLKIARKL